MEKETMSVHEASKRLGVDYTTVQNALRQNLYPFGTAVKGEKRWRYIIVRARFEKYMAAGDMVTPVKKAS